MRIFANFVPAVLAVFLLTTFATVFIAALSSHFSGSSHSLKFLYTVATESFEKLSL